MLRNIHILAILTTLISSRLQGLGRSQMVAKQAYLACPSLFNVPQKHVRLLPLVHIYVFLFSWVVFAADVLSS